MRHSSQRAINSWSLQLSAHLTLVGCAGICTRSSRRRRSQCYSRHAAAVADHGRRGGGAAPADAQEHGPGLLCSAASVRGLSKCYKCSRPRGSRAADGGHGPLALLRCQRQQLRSGLSCRGMCNTCTDLCRSVTELLSTSVLVCRWGLRLLRCSFHCSATHVRREIPFEDALLQHVWDGMPAELPAQGRH